jgi:hypothetical protein
MDLKEVYLVVLKGNAKYLQYFLNICFGNRR